MSDRLTIERDYPVDGQFHGAVVYRVNGMPACQRATIESQGIRGDRWRVERFVEREGARYMGEYPSAEQALAGLQKDIDAEMEENAVIELLKSTTGGHLIYAPVERTVHLYDSDPTWGSPRPALMKVGVDVFERLVNRGAVVRVASPSHYARYDLAEHAHPLAPL